MNNQCLVYKDRGSIAVDWSLTQTYIF